MLALVLPLALAAPPAEPLTYGVWTTPLTLVPLPTGFVYLGVGGERALAPRTTAIAEVVVTHAQWYTCSPGDSTGAWVQGGPAWYTRGAMDGGFVAPELKARVFHTVADDDEPDCAGWDAEVAVGLDVGWAFPLAPRAKVHGWIAPTLGASAGWCVHCFDPDGTFHGSLSDLTSFDVWGGVADKSRRTAPTWGLDVRLVRLGVAW